MDNSARIFVAGHDSLIGAAMVRRLDGYKNVITTQVDLTDAQATNAFFKKEQPEYVVLAAGLTGGIVENRKKPVDFLHINTAIALNTLQAAHQHKVKKLIYFGSSCMYPAQCPQPMKEDQLLTGKPDVNSLSTALAKLTGLQLCLSYNQQYGTQFIPVIPNNAYGPHDDFDPASAHVLAALIHRFHEAKKQDAPAVELWGSGTPHREFIHADDIADACLLLLKTPFEKLELPINIGTGQDHSIRALATMISNIIGYSGQIKWDTTKPDGAPSKLLDSSRINSLGWKHAVMFKHGIEDTYLWYQENAA
jgi:GDP-L-fucose synthase